MKYEENTQKLTKRQQAMMSFVSEHEDRVMESLCHTHNMDIPNHAVTAAYRWGFDDGSKWEKAHPIGVLDEDYVWAIYNFVNDWKNGKNGEKALQLAIKDDFTF